MVYICCEVSTVSDCWFTVAHASLVFVFACAERFCLKVCLCLQACICGYPIATGAASRLASGYDSYGNTCGQNNTKIDGVALSGRDMRPNK